jgi:hypothetical protein
LISPPAAFSAAARSAASSAAPILSVPVIRSTEKATSSRLRARSSADSALEMLSASRFERTEASASTLWDMPASLATLATASASPPPLNRALMTRAPRPCSNLRPANVSGNRAASRRLSLAERDWACSLLVASPTEIPSSAAMAFAVMLPGSWNWSSSSLGSSILIFPEGAETSPPNCDLLSKCGRHQGCSQPCGEETKLHCSSPSFYTDDEERRNRAFPFVSSEAWVVSQTGPVLARPRQLDPLAKPDDPGRVVWRGEGHRPAIELRTLRPDRKVLASGIICLKDQTSLGQDKLPRPRGGDNSAVGVGRNWPYRSDRACRIWRGASQQRQRAEKTEAGHSHDPFLSFRHEYLNTQRNWSFLRD